MKVLVIGSGRIGQRHIKGCLNSAFITEINVLDIEDESLENAIKILNKAITMVPHKKFTFTKLWIHLS
jgi:malate/lactate dehydrogenase